MLAEWTTAELPGVTLSHRDRRLAEQLANRRGDAAIEVYEVADGVRVSVQGCVGIVAFDSFELRIEPKLAGDHLQIFRMLEFTDGLSGLSELAGTPEMQFAGESLLDLVIRLLCRQTERLIAGGLRADYVEREGDLPAIRGRFLADRQYLDRLGVIDRLVCRYDEHEHDIPDNQLLGLALRCGARVAASPPVRRRALAVLVLLEEVCHPEAFDLALGREAITYDRMNGHYREAHALSWLLLDGTGPDHDLTARSTSARSFLINMNDLFERFVERVLERLLAAEYLVQSQKRDSIFWDADRGQRYSSVRPDLLITGRQANTSRFPIDAKYKPYGPEGRKISASDLSQAFLYAYAYRNTTSEAAPRAALIFPIARKGKPSISNLQVRSVDERAVDAHLIGLGFHIPTLLDELEGTVSTHAAQAPMSIRALRAALTEGAL